MFDFETLRIIWWVLLGGLFIGFTIFGGIDLGVATLLPFLAKNDVERRIMLNSVAPTWEGNQVWFILGGGTAFAAWPFVYAIAFSNFYYVLFLVLLALILKPVGLDYRSKIEKKSWRKWWDIALFISGIVPSVVFGIAVGNLLQGINFDLDQFMFIKNSTKFASLFTPFTLLCGLLSLSMIITQGSIFTILKTVGIIQKRARKILLISPLIMILLFVVGGFFIKEIDGFTIAENLSHYGPSNPHNKIVYMSKGAWLQNYQSMKWTIFVPILTIVSCIFTWILAVAKKYSFMIITNSLAIIGIISTVGLSMFPFIIPSKSNPLVSLTVWDASGSEFSLFVMLIAVIIFMPLILLYTGWAYKIMFGKVTEKDVKDNSDEMY